MAKRNCENSCYFRRENPHPNFLVGGIVCAINTDDASGLNAERLALVQKTF